MRIEYRLVVRPSGAIYESLLRASVEAAEWMGLVAGRRDAKAVPGLEPFLLRVEEVTEWPGTRVERAEYRWVYSVSDGLVDALLEASSSLSDFAPGHRQGDLHLMRPDGGVWLASCVCHEDYWLELDEAEHARLASGWPRVAAALRASVMGQAGFLAAVETGQRLRAGAFDDDLVRRYVRERSEEWPFPRRSSATGTVGLFDDVCVGLDAATAALLADRATLLASSAGDAAEFGYLALLIVQLVDELKDLPSRLVEEFDAITARAEALSDDDPWMWWVSDEWTNGFLPWRKRLT